jgi:hypothetical protein
LNLAALTPREASIFACLCDTVVGPEPLLPAVRDTDAVAFLDGWLARAPRLNRIALRGLLYLVELVPRAFGQPARLRRLDVEQRTAALAAVEGVRNPQGRQLVKLMKGIAFLSYYSDDRVMLQLGYDADANVRRARELRAKEARP